MAPTLVAPHGVRRVRVALVTEDGYPYREDAQAAWCRRLVLGIDDYEYHLVGVVSGPLPPARRPTGAASLTAVPLTGRINGPDDGPAELQHRRLATHAAVLLCRGMMDDTPHSAAMFRSALRRLTAIASDGTHPLHGVPLAAVLLDAWRAGGGAGAEVPVAGRMPPRALPRPTLRDAQLAADLISHATRALSVPAPPVDVCHTGGGLGTLVALAALWRHGVPFVLTEHDRYQAGPLAGRAGARPAVRAVVLRFLRALTRLGYAEAAVVAPTAQRMLRWALHHGAAPDRVTLVPPGVDPRDHPPLPDEPAEPVLAWLGPDRELPLVLRAHRTVRRRIPGARLIVIGSGPARDSASVPEGVNFTGPVTAHRALYAMARVVVLSGALDTMPYPLVEAMLCGRPVVCVEHGGLAATVGPAGVVVPPGDPARLAAVCVDLLTDARVRRDLAVAARNRATTVFSRAAMLDGYRAAYTSADRHRPACAAAKLGAGPRPVTAGDPDRPGGERGPARPGASARPGPPTGPGSAGRVPPAGSPGSDPGDPADDVAPPAEPPRRRWRPRAVPVDDRDDATDPLPLVGDTPAHRRARP